MTRIIALVAGLLLIGFPAWWLSQVSVPLPAYRKGGYADFLFLGQQLVAIYGSVLLGIGAYWAWAKRSGQPPSSFGLFKAGMLGVVAGCIAFFGGGSIYSLARYGAFDKAIGGNLWGLLAIFWGILGAFVSVGIALLFYAWRGPTRHAGASSGSGVASPPRVEISN
jgi:hypothetical protein